ncbi:MAG: hypothetical protein IK073_06895 [Paludibacteraceae bacterium]|nr:hypothetical protein [Paludibacteraceae bacterium]
MKKTFRLLIVVSAVLVFCAQSMTAQNAQIEGALPGVFSLKGGGSVRFSMGNLQYCAATNVWRFCPRQYGVVGAEGNGNIGSADNKSDNLRISPSYDGWIDLFCWGTSGWASGAKEYQPWSTSDESLDYLPEDLAPKDGNFRYDMVGSFSQADWGVHNPIQNGGNAPGLWRTLTFEEWQWIVLDRPNATNLNGMATIQGARGMVLLPDDWEQPWGASFEPGYGAGWDTNEYSYAEWKPLEDAGAVFLPCAGQRYYDSNLKRNVMSFLQESGRYWTASSSINSRINAYSFTFNSIIYEMYTYDLRSFGQSVRLVTDNK